MSVEDNRSLVRRMVEELWNVETWAMQDRLGLMQQVGAVPSDVDRADRGGHAGDRSPAR